MKIKRGITKKKIRKKDRSKILIFIIVIIIILITVAGTIAILNNLNNLKKFSSLQQKPEQKTQVGKISINVLPPPKT